MQFDSLAQYLSFHCETAVCEIPLPQKVKYMNIYTSPILLCTQKDRRPWQLPTLHQHIFMGYTPAIDRGTLTIEEHFWH